MNFKEFFSKETILKILLICLSIIMWMFFYTSLNFSLKALISINLPILINSVLTLNFLFFLLFFPITSAICISLSVNKEKNKDLLEIILGIFSGFLISFLLFGVSINFLLFSFFYLIAHLVLSILTYNKFKERTNFIPLANYATSKISLLLTLSLFIVVFLILLPSQASYYNKMQSGLVNLFVGDDISNWVGTSYSVNKASTASVVNFITESNEYQRLNRVQNQDVYSFIDFIEDLKYEVSQKTTREDIERVYANLNTDEVRYNVFNTLSNMPLMIVISQFFALFFALFIASMSQMYFAIAFSLVGLLYVYIFFKLFNINLNKKKDSKQSKKDDFEFEGKDALAPEPKLFSSKDVYFKKEIDDSPENLNFEEDPEDQKDQEDEKVQKDLDKKYNFKKNKLSKNKNVKIEFPKKLKKID